MLRPGAIITATPLTQAYLNDAGASGADCIIASILSSTSGVSLGSTSSDFKFSATWHRPRQC